MSGFAPETDPPLTRPPRAALWRVLRGAVRLVALGIVVFFVGWALVDRLRQVDFSTLEVRWSLVAAALAVQAVALVVWACTFHMLLGHLTRPPRPLTTFSVAWLSRLGKYIPGKVASVLGAVWLMRSRGVPAAAVLGASVLQQGLWIVLGLVASLPLTFWEPVRREFPHAWLACVIVGGAGLVCLHPRVFLPLANWPLRRLGIAPMALTSGARLYAAPAATVVVGIILAGVSLWLLVRAMFAIDVEALPLCIALSTLSAVVGYLVLFAPGGLGVREGITLLVLTPVIGPGPAAVITVLARLMQTAVEAIFGGAGALVLWLRPAAVMEDGRPRSVVAASGREQPDATERVPPDAVTVIVVSAPRGRVQGEFRMPPQTDARFDLVNAGRILRDLGLAADFDAAPGLSANYAAALASADVLAFVSAGAEPAPDYVAAVRRFFAEHPGAQAVIGGAPPAGYPTLHVAVRARAFRAADGCDILRPSEADVLDELVARLSASGAAVERDERIVVRPAAGLRRRGTVARAATRIAAWVRGGRYGPFESPILAPPSPMLLGPGDPRTPVASVVVPIKSSHRCALLALHALARQEMAEPYEVVACLAPGAPLAADIVRQIPRIRLCLRGSDEGPGGGRNAGIGVARGEIVAFTDADCLADRTWLRSMVAAVRGRGGNPVRGWWQVYHAWSLAERAMQLAEQGTPRPRRGRLVPGISGATMAVSRRLLEESGARFAEGVYGAEEMALLAGLSPEARAVWLDPSAVVLELRRETFAGARRRMRNLGVGSGRLRKNQAMRGSALARHRWLVPLLVPARLLLVLRRHAGCDWRAAADFIRLAPLVTVFLIYYALGFAAGASEPAATPAEGKDRQ